MDNSINTIGNFLKSERQSRGLSLKEISSKIKIKVRILEDIEKNSFENLGGKGYAKALILNYVRFLELDEKQIMQKINESLNINTIYKRHDRSIQPKKLLLPANIFSIILLIIVICALILLVVHLFNTDVLTWPPFKNIKNKIEVKKVDSDEKPKKSSKLEQIKEKSKKNKVNNKQTISEKTLEDTTDYLDDLLFEDDKKNPLNYDNSN